MNEKADSALLAIPTPDDRDTWLKISMAYKAAGGSFETWDAWSKRGGGYDAQGNKDTWRSISPGGKVTEATLYAEAQANGWENPERGGYTHTHTHTHIEQQKPKPPKPTPKQAASIQEYIDRTAAQRSAALPYLKTRGIDEKTAARFNIGWDEDSPYKLVIPYPGSDTPYYWRRRTDIAPNEKKTDEKGKTIRKGDYPQGIAKQIFNRPALNAGNSLFIVEGQIDAITLEMMGGAAVASNDTGELMDAIQADGTTVKQFFIIADADTTGQTKAGKMLKALNAAGYEAYIYPLPADYHDVNDFHLQASPDLYEWIRNAGAYATQVKAEALAEYQKISAAGRMPHLWDYIRQTPPAISTGYPTLDLELGDGGFVPGGLLPGLYAIGAISSLGKTTFVMQMADSIAAAGHDVLIISLEMSAYELMAKSISRLTIETAGSMSERKTVQGILQGTRYERYNPGERRAIDAAAARYAELAKNLYIIEGVGAIGAAQIRELTEKHIKITGRVPVVIIDYLQILAPADPRATDKMNADIAVLEMKRISRDHSTPVICISSFNRQNYKAPVTMEAFKESGGIDYGCDVIIGLQLKGVGTDNFDVDQAKSAEPREIEAKILKNRSGRTGQTIPFDYDAKFNHFHDVRQGHRIDPVISAEMRAGNLAGLLKK